MSGFEPLPPLLGDPARQAHASMLGYDYQIWTSLAAWLTLDDNEYLYLECGEDFDHISAATALAVQVKSSTSNITLASRDVLDAIKNFWRLSGQNRHRTVKLRFLTRGSIVHERGRPFGAEKGLEVWERAAAGDMDAIEMLRGFLLRLDDFPADLKRLLSEGSAEELQRSLFERLEWVSDAPGIGAVKLVVEDLVIAMGKAKGIEADMSVKAVDALLQYCREQATRSEPAERLLTAGHRELIFRERTSLSVPATPANLLIYKQSIGAELLRQFADGLNHGSTLPPPPADALAKTPLVSALEYAVDPIARERAAIGDLTAREAFRRERFAALRRAMVELGDAWAIESTGAEPENGRTYLYNGHAKLMAQDPETGDLSKDYITTTCWITSKYEFEKSIGETILLGVRHTGSNIVNGLRWNLDAEIRNGDSRIASALTYRVDERCWATNDASKYEMARACTAVLEKLMSGWSPVGLISYNVGDAFVEPVHPEVFSIELKVDQQQLENAHQRCRRILLGYELARTYRAAFGFVFTREFLDPALDDNTIKLAFQRFASHAATPFLTTVVGDIIRPLSDSRGVALKRTSGYMRFETVRRTGVI